MSAFTHEPWEMIMKALKKNCMVVCALIGVAACSNANGPNGGQLSLTFSTQASTGAAVMADGSAALMSSAPETYTDGQNTLVITKVEMVLREIELERVEVADCDGQVEPDDCEEFEIGPVLLDLPLGVASREFAVDLQPGAYDELEFEFHKVSSDGPEDAAFRAAHPDMVDKSIRVTGTFNGQPFTYVTDLDVEQEFDLAPPLTIDENTASANLTIRVGLEDWFRNQQGQLVDPQQANKGGQHESLVKENIKQSIEAFEDHDEDGKP